MAVQGPGSSSSWGGTIALGGDLLSAQKEPDLLVHNGWPATLSPVLQATVSIWPLSAPSFPMPPLTYTLLIQWTKNEWLFLSLLIIIFGEESFY